MAAHAETKTEHGKEANPVAHAGSIRTKLMVFTVLLCAVLIVLVWLLNVQLLEPIYHYTIQQQLTQTSDVYVALIREHINEDGMLDETFDSAVKALDNETLLSGKCLDISGSDCRNLYHAHLLTGDCVLHPTISVQGVLGGERRVNWNTVYAVGLREIVLEQGDQVFTDATAGQMIVCRNVDNRFVVFLSTDLARIGEAADVIGMQMPIIALVVLALGMLGALWFSRWFAKPITEISDAARAMAKGNYKVRVEPRSDDEIGALAQDFNTMAAEVARTAELQRDLIANISHDLRTPLTLIKGYAETIRDLTGDEKEKRDDQLNVIIDETDRLSALVNSVMELSKMSSGTEKLNRVQFDLAQLCEEVAFRYADICEKSGYTLETHTDEVCQVTADPDMMSRVIHNLLSNAIHHVGKDGWLALRCLPQEDGSVRVEVADHGEGIAPEELPYIFDRYYRARSSQGKIGTGLGLSITKAILINHGYAFGVQSTLGEGSIFWFVAK